MTRHYIKDEKGKDVKSSDGKRQFWSDKDGDDDPKRNQTVYKKHNTLFGGNTKIDTKYDPSKGVFKKKK